MSEKRPHSKYKIDRRLGCNLWGRPKSPYNTRQTAPGMHGARRAKPTDYGIQLFAKQKLKGHYGNIGERKFRRYYQEANRMRGDTGQNLIGLLESRLDAVLYRSKFVPTVFAARQFVSHKHVTVNGQKVNVPSYQVKPGDVIQVNDASLKLPMVVLSMESPEREVPEYMDVDHKTGKMTFLRVPQLEDVPFAVQMEPHLIVEFYSR